MIRVLVIAPHPDDEVLGCGGTIARYAARGDEVHLCVATVAYPPQWSDQEINRRRKEVLSVNHILGIKQTHFLDYPTVKLDTIPQVELNAAISKIVDKTKPCIIYLPHPGDVNRDHQLVFASAMVELRPKPGLSVRKILCYETLSETEWAAPLPQNAFVPDVYVDITETLATKLKAMSEYKLELKDFPHPRSLKTISALANLRGSTIGVKAAEAFMLIREIIS